MTAAEQKFIDKIANKKEQSVINKLFDKVIKKYEKKLCITRMDLWKTYKAINDLSGGGYYDMIRINFEE